MIHTAEFCKQRLNMWLEAEEALATSQSYKTGTQELTRVNLSQVRKMITYWENELEKAGNGGKRYKTLQAVPRDL